MTLFSLSSLPKMYLQGKTIDPPETRQKGCCSLEDGNESKEESDWWEWERERLAAEAGV